MFSIDKNKVSSYGIHIATFLIAFSIAVLPVLLFNRGDWYPALHLFKWIPVFFVVAYASGLLAFTLLAGKWNIRITKIELFFFFFLLILLAQPLLIPIRNINEWVRNWMYFAALFGAVFVFRNLPIDEALPAILRAFTLVAAVSVAIGFFQQTHTSKIYPYILSSIYSQDRFMANTGMDSVLGAYLALASLAGCWLVIYSKKRFFRTIDFLFLIINCVGIWKTASRSAMLAFGLGFVVLIAMGRPNMRSFKKILAVSLFALLLLFFSSILLPDLFKVDRRDMSKIFSPDTLTWTSEGRYNIWGVTAEMIQAFPVLGVGLGNYKWHYMDAMAAFRERTGIEPLYTLWAHSEYLQLAAEIGILASLVFLIFLLYCAVSAIRTNKAACDPRLAWALAVITALMADSLFSRPMHRVETAFTLSLAIAVISRICFSPLRFSKPARVGVGGVVAAAALTGIALFTQSFDNQKYLGKYFYNTTYLTIVPSELREASAQKAHFLFADAFVQLVARENYRRTLLPYELTPEHYDDAIRMLKKSLATQPRFDELNMLMMVYQQLGMQDEAKAYFKYYPAEEREKILDGTFAGGYMID